MARAPRRPNGRYKMCTGSRGCGGKGYRIVRGKRVRHQRCGGDGWIEIGRRRSRRRVGGVAGLGVTIWAGCTDVFGSAGAVVAVVILAVLAVLLVLGAIARVIERATV